MPFGTVSVIMQDLDPSGVEQEIAASSQAATSIESPADGWSDAIVSFAVYDRSPSCVGSRIVYSDRVVGLSPDLQDKANESASRQLRGLARSLAARV